MNVAQAFSSRGAFLVRQGPKINGWPRSRAAGDGRKGSLQHPWACLGIGILYQAGQRAVVQNPDGSCARGSLLEGTCRALCPLCGHRPLPASGGLSFSGGTWLWWPQAWLAPLGTEPFLSSKGIFCPSSIPWEWGFGAVFPLQELSWALSRRCVPPGPGGIQHVPDLEQDPATLRQDPPGQDPAPRTVAVPVTSFPSPGGTGGQLARGM